MRNIKKTARNTAPLATQWRRWEHLKANSWWRPLGKWKCYLTNSGINPPLCQKKSNTDIFNQWNLGLPARGRPRISFFVGFLYKKLVGMGSEIIRFLFRTCLGCSFPLNKECGICRVCRALFRTLSRVVGNGLWARGLVDPLLNVLKTSNLQVRGVVLASSTLKLENQLLNLLCPTSVLLHDKSDPSFERRCSQNQNLMSPSAAPRCNFQKASSHQNVLKTMFGKTSWWKRFWTGFLAARGQLSPSMSFSNREARSKIVFFIFTLHSYWATAETAPKVALWTKTPPC